MTCYLKSCLCFTLKQCLSWNKYVRKKIRFEMPERRTVLSHFKIECHKIITQFICSHLYPGRVFCRGSESRRINHFVNVTETELICRTATLSDVIMTTSPAINMRILWEQHPEWKRPVFNYEPKRPYPLFCWRNIFQSNAYYESGGRTPNKHKYNAR